MEKYSFMSEVPCCTIINVAKQFSASLLLINYYLRMIKHLNSIILQGARIVRRLPIRSIGSDSAAYDGDGKTTVRVLNDDEPHLNLVNTYSAVGFRLSNNLFINGSILLFPTHVYSWNVKRGIDITVDSLVVFDLIVPKTKIIIIGYGQNGEPYDPSIPLKLKKKGISCEMLPTANAVTTYNYLVHDSVHVAGAFVPVKDHVKMQRRDVGALYEKEILEKDHDMLPLHDYTRDPIEYHKKRAQDTDRDPDKKKFDK